MHRNKIDMPRTKRLTRRAFALYAALVLVCCAATPVLAEGDPLTVVNNLSTFIFSIIRAIGLILLGCRWACRCRAMTPASAARAS